MKLRVNRIQIVEGLQKAGTIIPSKSGAAYLRAIWLKAEDKQLYIMTTDASLEFTGIYWAEVEEPGLVGVTGRTLVDLIRQFPAGEMEMEADIEKNNFLLKQGKRGRYKLPMYSPEWFQPLAEFPDGEPVAWSGDFLMELIERIAFCIDDDESRDALACLCFKPRANGKIEACGMNGHQFAMVTFIHPELCAMLPEKGLLINKKFLQDIKKLLTPDEIELNLSEKRLFLRGSNGSEILSIVLNNNYEYPDYNVFLSNLRDNGANVLTLPRKEMIEALKRINVFAVDGSQSSVYMTLGEHELGMKANSTDGFAQETMEVEYKGALNNITFPTRDLIEIFGHFKSETMLMTFTEQEGPCGITGTDEKDYTVILMPMRVAEEVYYDDK